MNSRDTLNKSGTRGKHLDITNSHSRLPHDVTV